MYILMSFPFFSFSYRQCSLILCYGYEIGVGYWVFEYICFIIVFVPPIYDDNVNPMLYLSKRVFYFWFVLLRKVKSNFIFFLATKQKILEITESHVLREVSGCAFLQNQKHRTQGKTKNPTNFHINYNPLTHTERHTVSVYCVVLTGDDGVGKLTRGGELQYGDWVRLGWACGPPSAAHTRFAVSCVNRFLSSYWIV